MGDFIRYFLVEIEATMISVVSSSLVHLVTPMNSRVALQRYYNLISSPKSDLEVCLATMGLARLNLRLVVVDVKSNPLSIFPIA